MPETNASLTTVQHVAEAANQQTGPSFLDLPAECRIRIYEFVFEGAQIHVTVSTQNHLFNDGGYTEDEAEHFLTHTLNCNRDFLLTCKTIRNEATPFMSSAITLTVYPHQIGWRKYERRVGLLSQIPSADLVGIRHLVVDIHSFRWIPLDRMPSLKEVILTLEDDPENPVMYDVMEDPKGWTEDQALNGIFNQIENQERTCRRCVRAAKKGNFKVSFLVKLETTIEHPEITVTIDIEQRKITKIVQNAFWRGGTAYSSFEHFITEGPVAGSDDEEDY